MSSTWFFAAFSAALVVSALVGPRAGRTVDAIGGREVLAASNVILAVGLTVLAFAHSQTMLWMAWLILGLGMGIGLYDTAFAALGRIYGLEARSAITGITLLAGFASTVGWPLTAWGASELGWRDTCLAWAAAHIVMGLPLNLLLPTTSSVAVSADDVGKPHIPIDRPMLVLGFAFAASWTVVTAMAVHSAAPPRSCRRQHCPGGGRGRAYRSLAGWRPHPGGELDEALSSNVVSPAIGCAASCGCRGPRAVRSCCGISSIHHPARRRERHSHHRARNGAAGHVRSRRTTAIGWGCSARRRA